MRHSKRSPFAPLLLAANACLLLACTYPGVASAQDPAARTPQQKAAENYATKLIARADVASLMGNFRLARDSYQLALEELEKAYGAHDLRLITPLRGLANTRLREDANLKGARLAEGVDALKRVARIYAQYSDVTVEERLRAQLDLGDYYVLAGSYEEAAVSYRNAWQVLVRSDGPQRAAEYFRTPVKLRFNTPPGSQDERDRMVEVQFTITGNGDTDAVKTVEHDAPRSLVREVQDAFEDARFRPRLVDGQAVDTEDVRIRLTYPMDGSPAFQE